MKKTIKGFICIFLCFFFVFVCIYNLTTIVYPVNIQADKNKYYHIVNRIVDFFKIDLALAESLVKHSIQEGMDPFFIASLFYTESNLRDDVVSPKGYKGISQIPAKWHTPYTDINILIGIKIFKDKLKYANGDIREAVRLYKGFPENNPKWKKVSEKFFEVYNAATSQH